ncbi:MAG: ferrochelatase [Myxococcota bacterium]|nr:ferrochelatase [Myxococcota bacterium]
MELRTGILLVNLGSPESPNPGDVRRYLREFLSDPRVLDIPTVLRTALLEGVILPFRPRRSAAAYRQIWTPEGSPLLVHGRALRAALASALGPGYVVELAMRYGTPSLRGALLRLAGADVARIVAVPLYPQYSTAATGSTIAALEAELRQQPELPPLECLPPFHSDPGFIRAWTEVAGPELDRFRPDYVLFSYHGLPVRQLTKVDARANTCLVQSDCCDTLHAANRLCYRAHCYATTRALAAALSLEPARHGVGFQSRLGGGKWIRPYTDKRLPELAAAGHRRLAILCPAFVADCLETLEEIGIRARDQWKQLGGEALHLVPSLNAHPAWVEGLASRLRSRA